MNRIEVLSEGFKLKYEKFLVGCDSLEETNRWDKESFGEMEVYYVSDLTGAIIRLIAADGNFSQTEADFINDVFGFNYSVSELKEIYEDFGEDVESAFVEEIENGISMMKSINEELAEAYKDLLHTVCDIVIASDGMVSSPEVELANRLKAL